MTNDNRELALALQALNELANYEPEQDYTPVTGADTCPDCRQARDRQWPPSGLCNTHYCQLSDQRDSNERRRRNAHYDMSQIARRALASIAELKAVSA